MIHSVNERVRLSDTRKGSRIFTGSHTEKIPKNKSEIGKKLKIFTFFLKKKSPLFVENIQFFLFSIFLYPNEVTGNRIDIFLKWQRRIS